MIDYPFFQFQHFLLHLLSSKESAHGAEWKVIIRPAFAFPIDRYQVFYALRIMS